MNFIYDTAPPVHMLLIEAVAPVVGWEHKLNHVLSRKSTRLVISLFGFQEAVHQRVIYLVRSDMQSPKKWQTYEEVVAQLIKDLA